MECTGNRSYLRLVSWINRHAYQTYVVAHHTLSETRMTVLSLFGITPAKWI